MVAKKAMLVGNNYPGQQAELKGCVNDGKSRYIQSRGVVCCCCAVLLLACVVTGVVCL